MGLVKDPCGVQRGMVGVEGLNERFGVALKEVL